MSRRLDLYEEKSRLLRDRANIDNRLSQIDMELNQMASEDWYKRVNRIREEELNEEYYKHI